MLTNKLKPIASPQNVFHEVAIVIAGQNSEQFLDEAIESALAQSLPCEVVYADDCSVDASLATAARYIPSGLRLLPSGVHQGVCAARNRGALATTAHYIIFLDTDDKLHPDYARKMLTDISVSETKLSTSSHAYQRDPAPFVYPSTRCFGDQSTFWQNLEWSKYDKWQQNQVSTTSLWRRSAFIAAGMWQDLPTMWDYDLAIRCSRFGTPVAGSAILDYRIHEDSQSSQLNERFKTESLPYREMIRRRNATLGISCLISGRLPNFFPEWLNSISRSVRYAMSRGFFSPASSSCSSQPSSFKPKLNLVLHTKAQEHLPAYTRYAAKFSDTFSSIELSFLDYPVDILTEYSRRHSVCRLMANYSQSVQDSINTDLVWFIEDDIKVPVRACYDLYQFLTSGDVPAIGASGRYYNRHLPTQQLGGWIKNNKHSEPSIAFGPECPVDFVGTGCLMFWRDRPPSPRKWQPISKIENATAHDWAWSEDVISSGGKLFVLGDIDCLHYVDEVNYI